MNSNLDSKQKNFERALEKQMEKFVWWMDERFRIPGTRIRFGLDSIIGIIPGFGDLLSSFLSLYLFAVSIYLGVPPSILLRMAIHESIDFVLGSVPFLGDIFDLFYAANRKNLKLILQYRHHPQKVIRNSKIYNAAIITLSFVIVFASIAVVVATTIYLWSLLLKSLI